MVNTGRHGDIKLEYKPCQKHSACSEYIVQREFTPLSCDQNGSNYKVHAQNTSETARNKQPPDNITLYKYHQISPESPSYSCITPTCHVGGRSNLYNRYQLLDTLPYLEIPLSRGSRTVNSCRSKSPTLYSIPSLFGSSRLKLAIFSIIISMLLLCKGCTCFCSENLAVSVPPHPYLTQFNESNMAAVSGQCLTVTGSFVELICEQSKKEKSRVELLRDLRTDFCGLPLDIILSQQEKNSVQCALGNGCGRVINRVQEIDEELRKMYCQFTDVLERIDCGDMFPTAGDCDLCKAAYKRWLCSVYNTYYIKDEQIKPCIDVCDHVSETCPFFRPHGETLIGEPGFLCKDSKSVADAAASVYGPAGCCYKPHDVFFEMTGTEDINYEDTVTSNCTAISKSSSCSHSSPNRVLYVLIICWITSSWFRHITFPWNNSIGLT